MTFFKKETPPPSQPIRPAYTPPKVPATRGDRALAARIEADDMIPEHRRPAPTLEGKGRVGLTNARVLEREPRGCLFKVAGGFFDLDGYWVRVLADRRFEVRRGAPRKINALLTDAQKKELARVRLNARRHGVR